jgi:hypothetical protein
LDDCSLIFKPNVDNNAKKKKERRKRGFFAKKLKRILAWFDEGAADQVFARSSDPSKVESESNVKRVDSGVHKDKKSTQSTTKARTNASSSEGGV